MKKVIKNSILMLALLIATQVYSNQMDSIIINDDDNNGIITIEKLKQGTLLSIKDDRGMTLHKEKIKKSGLFSKRFNLENLPDATYYIELDNDTEIRTFSVEIKDQQPYIIKSDELIVAKPQIEVNGSMVKIEQNSHIDQSLEIKIYYEGNSIALEESFKDFKNFKRSYDFSGSMRGDYTIVLNTKGKQFVNSISIP